MAKKGGALPAYEELEQLRSEGAVPVRRFLARLGIPSSTWYHWRAAHLHGRTARRRPAPVVDAIEERAAEQAHRWSAWGHRKIWAMLRADGVRVSRSSVLRALARRNLLLPARYQAERRQLAVARRALFVEAPTRRNRVWQTDFTEYETSRGGTWRLAPVVDYATRLCLAVPVSGTTGARDAIGAVEAAIDAAERLMGHSLLEDCGLGPEAVRSTSASHLQRRCRAHATPRSAPGRRRRDGLGGLWTQAQASNFVQMPSTFVQSTFSRAAWADRCCRRAVSCCPGDWKGSRRPGTTGSPGSLRSAGARRAT